MHLVQTTRCIFCLSDCQIVRLSDCYFLPPAMQAIMEIITKEGQEINRYTPSEDQSHTDGAKGKRVGVAYELEDGKIIYVPE